jgi:tRNA U38,U39,U40 pseudouridine synthase TruA
MHNMVRILVAMALEVGRNKITLEQLKFIMDQKNRVFSPKILPSSGLYLVSVFYPDDPKFDPNPAESIIKTE